VAIGAHQNDGNGDNSGHVRIFRLNETSWGQIGTDIDGETSSEQFSKSVAINNDGTIVAIGSPSANYPTGTNLTGIGKVRVFQFNGTDWNQIGSNIYGEAKDDRSGTAISLSSDGKTLAIGAPLNGGNRGHVRIYRFDGSNWNQFGNDIDGKAIDHLSGTAVSLGSNGLTVAIGSPTTGAGDFHGRPTDLIGYARVYSYNSAGSSWDLVGSDINGLKWRDGTGQSVSLSGDGSVVAVSSVNFTVSGSGASAGQVRIFQLSGGNWQQIGADINGLPGDHSGSSLSLTADGRTVAIGSPYHNHNGSNSTGTSRIYRLDGTQWNQVAENLVGESSSDYSGNAISISSDGNMVAVGAYLNDGSGGNAGHVRVHRIHDPNKVQEYEYQEDADTQTINLYGISAGPNETHPLRVTASSSKANLIPNPTVTYTTPEATGTLQFTPVPDQHGTATITVTVEDGGLDNDLEKTADNATFSRSFDIIVTPVNDRPVITVLGDSNLTIEGLRSGEYSDAGATAWDVEDGDLTNDVSVSGDLVNLGKRGAYALRYDVEDSAELAAEQQSRSVTVVDTLPPVLTLRLDNQVIHISDHSQIGAGGVTNTDPGQPQLTNHTSVGNATKLANPIYRDTTQKQPDGSDVRSRQDWTGREAAGTIPDPELPTASAWDRLDTPITVNATYQRIDLDGTACTENCSVAEINFSQRSTYLLEYDAHDQAGNHAEQVVFALILDDRIAPSITVAGGNAETIEFGSDWTLAESTALDNIDGNLTANIRYQVDNVTAGTVLGTDLTYAAATSLVTTSVVADYMVTMTVSDQAGIYGQDSTNNNTVAHKAVAVRHTVNVPPTLNEIPKQTVVEDSLEQAVNLGGITPGGIEVQPVRVTATSSKPDLIPDPEVTYNDGNTTGTLKFKPVADQHGTATITVTVEDGGLDNNLDTLEGNGTFTRTFDMTVTPVNDLPIAGDATYRPRDNTRLDKNQATGLAALVTDIDKDPLTFSLVTAPSDGTLVLNEDGSYHYTPNTNFNLTDSFTYRTHDGTVASNVGTITLQVDTDYSWHNCREPRDVNADDSVTPLDVLWILNTINRKGPHPLTKLRLEGITKPFLDVNRDAQSTPLDALWIINYLNQRSFGEGEGVSETPAAALAIDRLMNEQAMRRERLQRANRPVTAVTSSVSQPVVDNTPYWQRVDEAFDSIIRPARRSELPDAAADRDELFEQSDWLDFLSENEST